MSKQEIPDRLLSPKEAAAYLNISVDWLARERWQGTGPAYVRLSGRRGGAIRYRQSVLEALKTEMEVRPAGSR